MAGLLAWAADVVGGNHDDEDISTSTTIAGEIAAALFNPEQQQYALDLDQRASSLRRSIHELRLRIPPSHISQRLPHLHAHSVASSAALALQLNAHSTTREEAHLRETTLQEENAAYEKAISNCKRKIQEKLQEADMLQSKLKEIDLVQSDLKAELEKKLAAGEFNHSGVLRDDPKDAGSLHLRQEPSRSIKHEELEDKKRELSSMEEMVQSLENQWSLVEQESVKQPSPAQREKLLEKQLHSLIEQLMAKQAQAEGLIREVHDKEKELESLNGMRRRMESGITDANIARNRFGRSSGSVGSSSTDAYRRSYAGGRTEIQQRLMLLRSAFVVYILALHVIVFIKISF